ncbi:hypothetical protein EVC24_168 [Rhizobium phage RHph_I4]|nr:hypothetical protein EVC24_168 [Rhizobium phage RHph_I4]
MTGQANINLIRIGSCIRHNNRQSNYRVIGRCEGNTINAIDGGMQYYITRSGLHGMVHYFVHDDVMEMEMQYTQPTMMLPLTIQVSDKKSRKCLWIIYQCLEDNKCWARPADEFQDRFTLLD